MSRTLRVVLASGIFPPESGGPATFVPALATALVERGHDVVVVTNGEQAPSVDERFPFQVERVVPQQAPVRYTKQVSTLVQMIRDLGADVVFSNAMEWQAVLAARITGRPVVSKVVGDMAWQRCHVEYGLDDDIETFEGRTYGPRIELLKAFRTLQVRGADTVVVPSNYLADLVAEWGVPPDQVKVIYNAIESPDAVPSLDERDLRIVFVGRLVDWKGVDGVIDAVARLEDGLVGAQLHIVGDGPERAALERQARSQLADERYVFHGRVPHEEVLRIVGKSRVFALNSTYEGLPHVVLEAMACGTPAVVSDAGGNPEAVEDGETGYVVSQGDASAFADRFERLLSDDETWHRHHETGLQRVFERFDSESMIESYENLLLDCTEN